jgi:hypothetical protein
MDTNPSEGPQQQQRPSSSQRSANRLLTRMWWLRQQEDHAPLLIAKDTIAIKVRRVPKTRRKKGIASFQKAFPSFSNSIYEIGKGQVRIGQVFR